MTIDGSINFSSEEYNYVKLATKNVVIADALWVLL